MVRYVWLNMNDGKFSNSWSEEEHFSFTKEDLEKAINNGFKLIKYECINDENFEFYNQMKLR